jgi:hypothetical protein
MLAVSNIYGHGFDSLQLAQLERLGFSIRPQASRYMGAQLCRFIDFEQGPCLELIEVEDERAYMEFIPEGMRPYCPGISLAVAQTEMLKDYEREFRHLRPYRLHINYDGSVDSPGPGWNYLNFGQPVAADTFIWLTGYDDPKSVREHISNQPNTVKGITGMVFDLEMDRLKEFRQLVKSDLTNGSFEINGLRVWPRDMLAEALPGHNKLFPLAAIILQAEKLDYFTALSEQARPCSWIGRPAVHFATNRYSWDLIVTA